MSDQFISVSTMIKGRFRLADSAGSPMLGTGAAASASTVLREEALLSARQNDAVMRFLIEMDRKLDAILGLLQRDSLAADFPEEGRIVRLSGSGLALECRRPLAVGQHMELLLLLEEMPVRLLSVMTRVEAARPGEAVTGPDSKAYDMAYVHMREEDREAVVRFVFSEQRKMIRQRKGEDKEEE